MSEPHEVLKPTATEMTEAIAIPECVTPEGLRVRADLVRKATGDESCARHLELAADEIVRLATKRGPIDDDPSLQATGYHTAIEPATRHARLALMRRKTQLGYLVIPCEQVYDMGNHFLRLYDQLEGIG